MKIVAATVFAVLYCPENVLFLLLLSWKKKGRCCFKKSNRPPAPAERRHWLAQCVHGDELQTGAAAG